MVNTQRWGYWNVSDNISKEEHWTMMKYRSELCRYLGEEHSRC